MIANNEESVGSRPVFNNRTVLVMGLQASPNYEIGHVGDDTTSYVIPTVTWLKDGESVNTLPTNVLVGNNGALRSTLNINSIDTSTAGVYQCVFTDTVRSELFSTIPIRLEISKASHVAMIIKKFIITYRGRSNNS